MKENEKPVVVGLILAVRVAFPAVPVFAAVGLLIKCRHCCHYYYLVFHPLLSLKGVDVTLFSIMMMIRGGNE